MSSTLPRRTFLSALAVLTSLARRIQAEGKKPAKTPYVPSFLHPNDRWVILRGETLCDHHPCFDIVDLESGKTVMVLPNSGEDTYYGTPKVYFDPSGRFAVMAYAGHHHDSFQAWDLNHDCASAKMNVTSEFDLPEPGGRVRSRAGEFDLSTGHTLKPPPNPVPERQAPPLITKTLPKWLGGESMAPQPSELVSENSDRLQTARLRSNGHLLVWSGFSTIRELDPRNGKVLRCLSATMPHCGLLAFGRTRHEVIAARPADLPLLWNRLAKDSVSPPRDIDSGIRPPIRVLGPRARTADESTAARVAGSRALAYSAAGIAWGDEDGVVWVAKDIRAVPKDWVRLGSHPSAVRGMAFAPDQPWLLTGARDGSLILWDRETHALVARFPDSPSRINSVAIHSSELAASAGPDGVRIWDLKTRTLLRHLETEGAWVSQVAFSPDGARVGAALLDGRLRMWEAATGRLLWSSQGSCGWCATLAFHPDGQHVVAGYESGALIRWSAGDGSKSSHRDLKTKTAWSDRVHPIHGLAWSADGQALAVAQGDGIQVLDADLRLGRGSGWTLPLDWADGYT